MSEAEKPMKEPKRQWRRGVGILLAFLLIIGNGVYAFETLNDLRNAVAQVRHTGQLLGTLLRLQQSLRDGNRHQRDYLTTGDDTFLKQYEAADRNVDAALAKLFALARNNPQQQQRLEDLEQGLNERHVELAAGITRLQELGLTPITANDIVRVEQSVARIRASTAALQGAEQQVLDQRIIDADGRAGIALGLLAVDTAFSLVLIAVIFLLMGDEAKQHDTEARSRAIQLAARESELRASEARLRLALDGAGLGVWERDIRQRRERLDARAAAITGSVLPADTWLASDSALLREWDARVHADDRANRRAARQTILETTDTMLTNEYRTQLSDGSLRWIAAASTVVERDPTSEEAVRVVSVVQDITRRKQAELDLQHAQRMEAIGQLTGGLAHDFNNLLGVIIGNVEFLRDVVQSNPDHAELANEILNSALRGAELTRRLLAFARRQPLQPRLIDLNEHLPGQVSMLQRMIGETVQVSLRLAPDLWLARADPAQITDALLNLAINARDAMPHGGRLVIETAMAELDANYAAPDDELVPGEYVVLSVTDTGVGMTPEVMARAIEPFFTTKAVGQGSGLGLSMIYGFAKQSNGHLRLYSEIGIGTTVKLYLPRAHGVPQPAAITAPERLPGGHETILLVDDNAEMRAMAERLLTGLGYRVLSAQDGGAALASLRTSEAFDLLFTDIVMPGGMSGYQLADAAHALRPDLPVLFSSGFANVPSRGETTEDDLRLIIHKPYRRSELATKLREALDAAASQRGAAVG